METNEIEAMRDILKLKEERILQLETQLAFALIQLDLKPSRFDDVIAEGILV